MGPEVALIIAAPSSSPFIGQQQGWSSVLQRPDLPQGMQKTMLQVSAASPTGRRIGADRSLIMLLLQQPCQGAASPQAACVVLGCNKAPLSAGEEAACSGRPGLPPLRADNGRVLRRPCSAALLGGSSA